VCAETSGRSSECHLFGKEPGVSCENKAVRFHKIRELVATGELLLEKIHTFENAVDMLTKPVTENKFKHCLDLINVSRC